MEYFGITDKGRVRPTNQDIYRIEACPDRDSALVLVCDGMGGANAGNVASRFAAERFVEEAKPALEAGADETMRHETLRRALDRRTTPCLVSPAASLSSAAWARRSSAPSCRAGARAS